MTAHVLQYVELPKHDRERAAPFPKLESGDTVEMRVRTSAGDLTTVVLPPRAAALIEALLDHLYRGQRVAVLSEDREVTPHDAALILGMSRPLVVHRMDVGDLPFRMVGKHRRARLKDVLGLKGRLDSQRVAQVALAEDADELMKVYDV
jgi:hypothetical protein